MVALDNLLGRGYLPKELHGAFGSMSYAKAMAKPAPVDFRSDKRWGQPSRHNLARPGLTSRVLAIPDPVHFYRLADVIASQWSRIEAAIGRSTMSLSKPVIDAKGVRALVPALALRKIEARAEHRARARYLIQVDVSQFYPSVYSHALDWAIRGKAAAKASTRATAGLGPLLDLHTREGQDGQTIGIPIGPDSSLVLAELVLAQVDAELLATGRSKGLHGFRYYDDYELYTRTRPDGEQALADIQRILGQWQLTANPYKIRIVELPEPVEDEWISVLKKHQLRDQRSQERADINALFDESVRLARLYPRENVFAYALGKVITRDLEERHQIQKGNWPHFEKLLLASALGEPGLISKVSCLLNWAKHRGWPLNSSIVADALTTVVVESASRGNWSEVAWAVWTSSCLAIPLPAEAGRAVSGTTDDVVALTALDASSKGSLRGLKTTAWEQLMVGDSLRGEHWLLAYEALEHGWLPSKTSVDYISADPIFSHLGLNNVRFYDDAAKLPPVSSGRSKARTGSTPRGPRLPAKAQPPEPSEDQTEVAFELPDLYW